MKLNIQSAVEAKIVRKPAAEKEPVRIFDRYVEQTLAKLDRSISDARGRYEEGKQYAVAKPSLNWKVVNKVDDLSKNAKAAMDLLYTQPGAQYGEGSWWQALNSVTYLTDHKMGRSADTRMQSAWFGINQSRKLKAANKAVEFATAV